MLIWSLFVECLSLFFTKMRSVYVSTIDGFVGGILFTLSFHMFIGFFLFHFL